MLIGSDGFLGSRLQGGKFHPGFNGGVLFGETPVKKVRKVKLVKKKQQPTSNAVSPEDLASSTVEL